MLIEVDRKGSGGWAKKNQKKKREKKKECNLS